MLYILLSTILFGFLDALWKPIIDELGHLKTLLHRTILTTTCIGLYFIFTSTWVADTVMIFWTILSGCIAFLGLFCLTKAFQKAGTISVVFLNVCTILIGQISSLMLFDETIQAYTYGIHLIGALFVILFLNNFRLKLHKGIWYGLGASFCFGIAYPMMGIPIPVLGNLQATFIQEFTVLLCIVLLALNRGSICLETHVFLNQKLLLLVICTCISLILYFYAYTVYPVYKVNLISHFYPVAALLTAYIGFHEKPSMAQWIGVCLSIGLLISIGLN
ncbi:MAG: DMT family transporter [Flavobacteriaceae bacterium]